MRTKIFLMLVAASAFALPLLIPNVSLSQTLTIVFLGFALFLFKGALKLLRFLWKPIFWLSIMCFIGWLLLAALKFFTVGVF